MSRSRTEARMPGESKGEVERGAPKRSGRGGGFVPTFGLARDGALGVKRALMRLRDMVRHAESVDRFFPETLYVGGSGDLRKLTASVRWQDLYGELGTVDAPSLQAKQKLGKRLFARPEVDGYRVLMGFSLGYPTSTGLHVASLVQLANGYGKGEQAEIFLASEGQAPSWAAFDGRARGLDVSLIMRELVPALKDVADNLADQWIVENSSVVNALIGTRIKGCAITNWVAHASVSHGKFSRYPDNIKAVRALVAPEGEREMSELLELTAHQYMSKHTKSGVLTVDSDTALMLCKEYLIADAAVFLSVCQASPGKVLFFYPGGWLDWIKAIFDRMGEPERVTLVPVAFKGRKLTAAEQSLVERSGLSGVLASRMPAPEPGGDGLPFVPALSGILREGEGARDVSKPSSDELDRGCVASCGVSTDVARGDGFPPVATPAIEAEDAVSRGPRRSPTFFSAPPERSSSAMAVMRGSVPRYVAARG